jgi:hypothetical protein
MMSDEDLWWILVHHRSSVQASSGKKSRIEKLLTLCPKAAHFGLCTTSGDIFKHTLLSKNRT